jgi:uncharacterized membrane protein (DUF4010 family)
VLAWPFAMLGTIALLGGFAWSRRPDANENEPVREYEAKNPLELRSAFTFAGIFVVLLVVTTLVLRHFGNIGMYALGVVMGAVDVDPFIMGLAQTAGVTTPLAAAAAAILVTTASNNALKGVYAFSFADRPTGKQGLVALLTLSLLGLSCIALVL